MLWKPHQLKSPFPRNPEDLAPLPTTEGEKLFLCKFPGNCLVEETGLGVEQSFSAKGAGREGGMRGSGIGEREVPRGRGGQHA
ncbi:hypothetical protein GCM10011399_31260 [Subtercola lobariae]|uniref:Uncharacterized protein n=1 Tax=Subtercola lobariae TaxID=1588641 RepID=A0A917BBV7_9MICO|nr:hypothetical protein GCM10011399_31260 [Subtercola lobariae]